MESKTSVSGYEIPSELSMPKLLPQRSDTQGIPAKIDVVKAGQPTPISGIGPEGSADRDEWAYDLIIKGMRVVDCAGRELGRVKNVHKEKNSIDIDYTTMDKTIRYRVHAIPLRIVKEIIPDPLSISPSMIKLKLCADTQDMINNAECHIDQICD